MLNQFLSDIFPMGDLSDFLVRWGNQPEPSLYEKVLKPNVTITKDGHALAYLKRTSSGMENETFFVEDQCSLARLCRDRINTYVNETELGITTMAAVQVCGKVLTSYSVLHTTFS